MNPRYDARHVNGASTPPRAPTARRPRSARSAPPRSRRWVSGRASSAGPALLPPMTSTASMSCAQQQGRSQMRRDRSGRVDAAARSRRRETGRTVVQGRLVVPDIDAVEKHGEPPSTQQRNRLPTGPPTAGSRHSCKLSSVEPWGRLSPPATASRRRRADTGSRWGHVDRQAAPPRSAAHRPPTAGTADPAPVQQSRAAGAGAGRSSAGRSGTRSPGRSEPACRRAAERVVQELAAPGLGSHRRATTTSATSVSATAVAGRYS